MSVDEQADMARRSVQSASLWFYFGKATRPHNEKSRETTSRVGCVCPVLTPVVPQSAYPVSAMLNPG